MQTLCRASLRVCFCVGVGVFHVRFTSDRVAPSRVESRRGASDRERGAQAHSAGSSSSTRPPAHDTIVLPLIAAGFCAEPCRTAPLLCS